MFGSRFARTMLGGALALTAAIVLSSHVRSAQGATIVINEVQYDPSPSGSEGAYEWVELLNPGAEAVPLEGWRIADNRSSDDLPPVTLDAGAYLVVAAGEGFSELFPGFAGQVVTLGGTIGNGLGNSGDRVLLLDPDETVVDGMSYGNDAGVLDPSAPSVAVGHSLERVPAGTDTDTADDWRDQPAPSPGEAARMARPTASTTPAPAPTVPAGAVMVLNEYLPAPRDVDWDGDGTADANDEWVELFNPGEVELSLRGWQLDDLPDGGSAPFVVSDDRVIQPRGYLLLFKNETGVSLNNGGDEVRLLRPDGAVADATDYRGADADASYARHGDGAGPWTDTLPPSPGQPNPTGPAPTPGGAVTATPRTGPSATAPPNPTATPDATATPVGAPPTPGQPSPGPAATPAFLPYLVTEVMFDPTAPGNDAAAEWVEVYNRSSAAADLAGWSIGDRVAWDPLPAAELPAGGFAIVAASDAAVAGLDTGGAPVVVVADGRIGNGLANGGDLVRLRGPTGHVADAVSYGGNLDAFDPAVPIGAPGSSVERLPPERDTDSADDWWPQPAPSPGRAGTRHEGPPRVALNEVLPAPSRVDWDGDGAADHTDEWVELYGGSDYRVDLTGWRLVRGEPEAWTYWFPDGAAIGPGGFAVVYRSESQLALANDGDVLRLLRPDGVAADRFKWTASPGYDRSHSRTEDGGGEWTDRYAVTPGQPNRPESRTSADPAGETRAPDPARVTLMSDVRRLSAGVRVQVDGQITVPPGVFGDRTAYIGDETGGVMVFLRPRDGKLPALPEGAHVLATGVLKDYHGEREIVLERAADLWSSGPGEPLSPADVGTGALGEPVEGRLVRMAGAVTGWRGTTLTLDDGSGEARVLVRRDTGFKRPWVERGQRLSVVGIVGQYAQRSPWEGGYRLMPRYPEDFGRERGGSGVTLPAHLPSTGRAPTR